MEAITLSQLLEREGVRGAIDLLKIDVEGDELRVLQGLSSADYRRTRQVVVEVHDIHGRLDRCVSLLRRHGFRTTNEQQTGGNVQGYRMVVPDALRLHLVFATREGPALSVKRKR